MALLSAKQINKLIEGTVTLSGFSFPAGATANVTSALTTSAGSAGDQGSSVPVQVAGVNAPGFVVTGGNRVEVWDTKGLKLTHTNADADEVYGRLTLVGAVYTLSLFTEPNGTETAYSLPSAVNVSVELPYLFTFDQLPRDSLRGGSVRYVGSDGKGAGSGRLWTEAVTVTGTNTLATLSKTFTSGTVEMTINGAKENNLGGTPTFTVAAQTITWSAANAGYSLATTDVVYVTYPY